MFHLVRYFSIASLACFVAATVALWYWHRSTEIDEALETGTKYNATLTAIFANEFWPQYAGLVEQAAALPVEALRSDPRAAALAIQQTIAGIFDAEGTT